MKTKYYTESVDLAIEACSDEQIGAVNEAMGNYPGSALVVEMAAIHEGLTRNHTFYTKEGLTNTAKNEAGQPGGLQSWTYPYPAPLILDHDKRNANNVMGRVIEANWVEKQGKEAGHVALKFRVTNPEAIEKFLRGEYLTGSVGQEVDSASCSICGMDMVESGDMCGHTPGRYYVKADMGNEAEKVWVETKPMTKGAKRAYVKMGNVWGREYSIVSFPSDSKSKVKSMAHVTEMALIDEGENTLMTLIGKTVDEADETAIEETPVEQEIVQAEETVAEETPEEAVEETVEETPVAEETETTPAEETVFEEVVRSVQELVELYRARMETSSDEYDILSLYLELASARELFNVCIDDIEESVDAGLDTGYKGLKKTEIETLMSYIEQNNDDLEIELKELNEAVLSTSARDSLPDASFALIKTLDGKKLRALPYKHSDGSINKPQLRNALARWNQVMGFTAAEKARGLRKLRAAVAKAGILADNKSEQVIATDTSQLQSENEQLQIEVNELLRQVAEKEAHIDLLTEKLNSKVAEPVAEETVIEQEEVPTEPVVIEKVENQGLTLENSAEESTGSKPVEETAEEPTPEMLWRAMLGDKKAKVELTRVTRNMYKKLK